MSGPSGGPPGGAASGPHGVGKGEAPGAALPAHVATQADLDRIRGAAERVSVPCGEGEMVWHRWGAGPPVVLLHGGAGSWLHWVRNIAALVAQGRSVWAVDLPGFGESAPPATGHDADALGEPVGAALARLLGGAPCDLVGFSFGAMVASFVAKLAPERVRRLVLVGAPALEPSTEQTLGLRPWRHMDDPAERDAAHRHNLGALMLADADAIDALAIGIQGLNAGRDRMRRRRISRTDVLHRTLPDVRCPVYGIWGERDALYIGRAAIVEPALRAAPGFRRLDWIDGAGHWVQYERSEAFNRALAAALSAPD